MKRVLIAAAAVFMALPAWGQQACGPRENVIQNLLEQYGEVKVADGFRNPYAIIEIFANVEKGTWTITEVNTRGVTCILASGFYFNFLKQQGEAI